jgi:hypothetical protein
MGAMPSEYDAVIADLEHQLQEIQGTLDVLKRRRDQAGGGLTSSTVVTSPTGTVAARGRFVGLGTDLAIASDAFFGMSIVDAVKKHLSVVKKPQDTKAIVDALESGGFRHTSKNFYGTIFSVLRRRAKNEGDLVKVSSGLWALTDWYPALRRKGAAPKRDDSMPESEALDRMRVRPQEQPPDA